MIINGSTLEVDIDMDINDVIALYEFVKDRLTHIEAIIVQGEVDEMQTSALVQLLCSIKKTDPSISIPFIDHTSLMTQMYGTFHWTRP